MQVIQHQELASAQASITFTSIPSTFTDLYLVLSGRNSTTSDEIFVRFNSDSGSNYSWRRLQGTGAAALSDSSAGYGGVYLTGFYFTYPATISSFTANTFGSGNLYIPNYASSSAKSISSDAVNENNATTARQAITAGLWSGTAAISNISIDAVSGNFVQYSSATLYGITKGSDGIVTVS